MTLSLRNTLLLLIAVAVVALDQLSKLWIVSSFNLNETRPIIYGYFNLTYVRNIGVAFGMLGDAPTWIRVPVLLVVPLVALAVILYILRKVPAHEKLVPIALSLVAGGAVGNLIDRAWRGYVVDFLDFHWRYQYHFHIFNVADTAICVGVGLLILDSLFRPSASAQETMGDVGQT